VIMLRFLIVLTACGLVTGSDEVACIDDSDCVVLGHKYACFMYFCHNWVDPSPINMRCQSDWECGNEEKCYRHWNLRQVDEGVCFPKYQVDTCETHSDCGEGDFCCGIHCCSQFYFKQWQQFSCFSDMQCRSWKTGQFCCNDNLCCDDRSSEIKVAVNDTLEEANTKDHDGVVINQDAIDHQEENDSQMLSTVSTDESMTVQPAIEDDANISIDDLEIPISVTESESIASEDETELPVSENKPDVEENVEKPLIEIDTTKLEKASKAMKDISEKAKFALESAILLANETTETLSTKIAESTTVEDDSDMTEDEVSVDFPQEQGTEAIVDLDSLYPESLNESDSHDYHTVIQDAITVNVSSYDLYEEVSDESSSSYEVVTDGIEEHMKNVTNEPEGVVDYDDVENLTIAGGEFDTEYNTTDDPTVQDFTTEDKVEENIMEENNATQFVNEDLISNDDNDNDSQIDDQEATLNVSLIWKDNEEVSEQDNTNTTELDIHESEDTEAINDATFESTTIANNDEEEKEEDEVSAHDNTSTTELDINKSEDTELYTDATSESKTIVNINDKEEEEGEKVNEHDNTNTIGLEIHESEDTESKSVATSENSNTEEEEEEHVANAVDYPQITISPMNIDEVLDTNTQRESNLPDLESSEIVPTIDLTAEGQSNEEVAEVVEEPVLLNVNDVVTESNVDDKSTKEDKISTVYEILVDTPHVPIEKGRRIRYDNSESNSFESSEEFSDESTEECFNNGREVFDVTTDNTKEQSKGSYRLDNLDVSGLRETGIPDRMVAKPNSEDDSEVIGGVFRMPKKVLSRELSTPSFAYRSNAGITLIVSIVLIQLMQNS